MNQCWFSIGEVLWHSPESKFPARAQATSLFNEFEKSWYTEQISNSQINGHIFVFKISIYSEHFGKEWQLHSELTMYYLTIDKLHMANCYWNNTDIVITIFHEI